MLHLDFIHGLNNLIAERQYTVVYYFVNGDLLFISSVLYCHNVMIFVGVIDDALYAKWNPTEITECFDFLTFMLITVPD